MKKGLFSISYQTFCDSDKEQMDNVRKSVVGTDAENAWARCKKEALKESWEWTDEKGKPRKSRITRVRLLGIEHVGDIDL